MSQNSRPWLNASLSDAERVNLLLKEMTAEEKIAQMIQISYSIVTPEEADTWAKLGAGSFLHILGDNARRIQKLATSTRLGIPVVFGIDAVRGHAIHNGATVFPTQLSFACAWDENLAFDIARATAKEVAAEGLHWTFSPIFCLGRDLRWGRIDETFGEDKLLAGRLGAAMVRGYQGDSLKNADSIIACAKHFIAYGESTGGRDSYDSSVSMRSIHANFFPPFIDAINAGCQTIMAGYNPIDGIPCSANKHLLKEVLKDTLKFDGFVVTDWMNTTNLYKLQKVAKDFKEASKIALESGNDMIMTSPEFYTALCELLKEGKVDISLIDQAVTRILLVKLRAGLFDVPEKIKTLSLKEEAELFAQTKNFNKEIIQDESIFACAEHKDLALKAAQASIVLLKNEQNNGNEILPIDIKKIKTIAVIGPNADSVMAHFGDWTFFSHPLPAHDSVPKLHVSTLLDGLSKLATKHGIKLMHHVGCDIIDSQKEQIAEACEIAAKADLVVACVGDTLVLNGETHDRADLSLTGEQNRLVESLARVCAQTQKPLISVLINGKPLEFERVVNASQVVLEAFNPGLYGGTAIANILFGLSEPQGRLPISFPRKTGQLPVYYNQLPGWHGGKYCDCPETPLFAFGEGLSWTSFSYSNLSLARQKITEDKMLSIQVDVTNTGTRDGTELVQVYSNALVSSVISPIKELRAWKKVFIPCGKTVTIVFEVKIQDFAIINSEEQRCVEKGLYTIMVGHDSRDESLISAVFEIS